MDVCGRVCVSSYFSSLSDLKFKTCDNMFVKWRDAGTQSSLAVMTQEHVR